jgi:hypothetical protein
MTGENPHPAGAQHFRSARAAACLPARRQAPGARLSLNHIRLVWKLLKEGMSLCAVKGSKYLLSSTRINCSFTD